MSKEGKNTLYKGDTGAVYIRDRGDFRQVEVRGIVEPVKIIESLDKLPFGERRRERLKKVVTAGCEQMLSFLSEGGAITSKGEILPIKPNEMNLGDISQEELVGRGFVEVSGAELERITAGENQMFLNPHERIILVTNGIDARLGYTLTQGNAPYPRMESLSESDWVGPHRLEQAFSNRFRNLFEQTGLSRIVSSEGLSTQVLVHAAKTSGQGNIHLSPKFN